jgi:hypothetical protein
MRRTITTAVAAVAVAVTGTMLAPPSQARTTWDTTPVVVKRDVKPTPRVVDLRTGEHGSFDRVVIDLRGKVPGYRVAYVKRLRYDGSGRRVALRGKRFIAVRLTPARAHNAAGATVYAGPRLARLGMPTLRGVAFTGDFEGVVSFGLALSHRAGYRVFVLHAPNRLVVDLHH